MLTDALNTFCDNVALNTGGAGTYNLGDAIDLLVAGRGVGAKGGVDGLWLVITVDTTAASGGSATGGFALVTDDNSSFTSPTILAQTGDIPVATLVQGYKAFVIALPISDLYERYLGIQQITKVAAFTAGKINAFLTSTPPTWKSYPDAL